MSAVVETPAATSVATPSPASRGKGLAYLSLGVLTVMLAMAVFGELLAPYAPTDQSLASRLQPPVWSGGSWDHVFGTDSLGRDVLSRLIAGARLTIAIALGATLIEAAIGVTLGVLSGFRGGWTDTLIMRLSDVQLGFPGALLVLFFVLVIGVGPVGVTVALGIGGWMIFGRVIRVAVRGVMTQGFIEAARAAGTSSPRIVFRHVFPHIRGNIITLALFEMPRLILVESALSFVGLGVQPPLISWGLMIQENRASLQLIPSLVLLPGLMIVLTTVSLTLVASYLEPRLDPERRQLIR